MSFTYVHVVYHTHTHTHTHFHTGIHVFDALTGREIRESGAFRHQLDVVSLSLSHCGPSAQRLLAFTDKNHDLYITSVRGPHAFSAIRIGKYKSRYSLSTLGKYHYVYRDQTDGSLCTTMILNL